MKQFVFLSKLFQEGDLMHVRSCHVRIALHEQFRRNKFAAAQHETGIAYMFPYNLCVKSASATYDLQR